MQDDSCRNFLEDYALWPEKWTVFFDFVPTPIKKNTMSVATLSLSASVFIWSSIYKVATQLPTLFYRWLTYLSCPTLFTITPCSLPTTGVATLILCMSQSISVIKLLPTLLHLFRIINQFTVKISTYRSFVHKCAHR